MTHPSEISPKAWPCRNPQFKEAFADDARYKTYQTHMRPWSPAAALSPNSTLDGQRVLYVTERRFARCACEPCGNHTEYDAVAEMANCWHEGEDVIEVAVGQRASTQDTQPQNEH